MKKGEIYYFYPFFRKQHPSEADKKHPIVCLKDTENPSYFEAVILSHGMAPKKSPIKNFQLDIREFDSSPHYSVPGQYKEEWLVGKGLWKDVKEFPSKEAGKISLKELNRILLKLLDIENPTQYSNLSKKKWRSADEEYDEGDFYKLNI